MGDPIVIGWMKSEENSQRRSEANVYGPMNGEREKSGLKTANSRAAKKFESPS
jgi:hypothetical protein